MAASRHDSYREMYSTLKAKEYRDTLEDAKLFVEYALQGFAIPEYSIVTVRDASEPGTVVSQDPAPRTKVDIAGGRVTVTLSVSGGPDYTVTVTVPDVTGLKAEEAVGILHDAGISATIINEASSEEEYTVIRQSVRPDTELTGLQGTISIDITISRGPSWTEETTPETTPETKPSTRPTPRYSQSRARTRKAVSTGWAPP